MIAAAQQTSDEKCGRSPIRGYLGLESVGKVASRHLLGLYIRNWRLGICGWSEKSRIRELLISN